MTTKQLTHTSIGRRTSTIQVSALTMGAVVDLLVVIVGAFFDVRPPEAYGICMTCNTRHLLNWGTNHLLNTNLIVTEAIEDGNNLAHVRCIFGEEDFELSMRRRKKGY